MTVSSLRDAAPAPSDNTIYMLAPGVLSERFPADLAACDIDGRACYEDFGDARFAAAILLRDLRNAPTPVWAVTIIAVVKPAGGRIDDEITYRVASVVRIPLAQNAPTPRLVARKRTVGQRRLCR